MSANQGAAERSKLALDSSCAFHHGVVTIMELRIPAKRRCIGSQNTQSSPLREQVEANLDQKHDLFSPEYLPGPSDTEGDLFEGYELLKTFAVPLQVTADQELTFVLSKWQFNYTVRDDDHRRHLNLALDCGLGERNALGLGFCNLVEKRNPYGEPAAEVHG